MLKFFIRRLAAMVPMLLLVSVIVFSLILFVPGDPAVTLSGENATESQIDATRERLGLDDNVVVQYGRWLGGAVRGDFGTSLFSNQKVVSTVFDRVGVTLSLAISASVIALLIALPAGILAATRRGSWTDRFTTLGATAGLAMPNFWLGLVLVLIFSRWLEWLPPLGYVSITEDPVEFARRMLLPALTLGSAAAAELTRQIRSAMSGVLQQDYIRTSKAKGLPMRKVVLKHGLKNAGVPVATVLGFQIAAMLGGTVIIEQIFTMPGLGQIFVGSVIGRDLPMIQGLVLFTALAVMLVNLAVEVAYMYFNPKGRS